MPDQTVKYNPTTPSIGVFDSGLGGLSVLKYFLQELPEYHYVYLGDTARLPYGGKSPETIYRYAREAVDFLFQAGCRLVIIACNTASSQALRRLQQEYLPAKWPDRRVLGVIRPLAEIIAGNEKIRTVGIIGTRATVDSAAYPLELHKLRPELKVEQAAAPLLVPLIEEGWMAKPETKMILKKYLRPLKMKKVDALILGCTHYPFLYREIRQIMGARVSLPHPGTVIAGALADYLRRHPELGLTPARPASRRYYTTDDPQRFRVLGEKFLGCRLDNLQRVEITELTI
ncbi:MAG: glutamate racemase [Patescibacteria group bacterium]